MQVTETEHTFYLKNIALFYFSKTNTFGVHAKQLFLFYCYFIYLGQGYPEAYIIMYCFRNLLKEPDLRKKLKFQIIL